MGGRHEATRGRRHEATRGGRHEATRGRDEVAVSGCTLSQSDSKKSVLPHRAGWFQSGSVGFSWFQLVSVGFSWFSRFQLVSVGSAGSVGVGRLLRRCRSVRGGFSVAGGWWGRLLSRLRLLSRGCQFLLQSQRLCSRAASPSLWHNLSARLCSRGRLFSRGREGQFTRGSNRACRRMVEGRRWRGRRHGRHRGEPGLRRRFCGIGAAAEGAEIQRAGHTSWR
jgi:hypothetical protein